MYCLGNNNKKKKSAYVQCRRNHFGLTIQYTSEQCNLKKKIFSIRDWLNPQMWNLWTWRALCISCFPQTIAGVEMRRNHTVDTKTEVPELRFFIKTHYLFLYPLLLSSKLLDISSLRLQDYKSILLTLFTQLNSQSRTSPDRGGNKISRKW